MCQAVSDTLFLHNNMGGGPLETPRKTKYQNGDAAHFHEEALIDAQATREEEALCAQKKRSDAQKISKVARRIARKISKVVAGSLREVVVGF